MPIMSRSLKALLENVRALIAGRADAAAIEGERITLVVEWKSDVNPAVTTHSAPPSRSPYLERPAMALSGSRKSGDRSRKTRYPIY